MFCKKVISTVVASGLIANLLLAQGMGMVSARAVSPESIEQGFVLFDGTQISEIYADRDAGNTGKTEYEQVVRAVTDLQKDMQAVTGVLPELADDEHGLGNNVIIVGTIGHNDLIDGLIEQGKLNVDGVKGEWEAYTIQVVENPTDSTKQAIVIAGSDKRGTIYGVYEISEQIGVSPWYWWGDVPVAQRDRIVLDPAVIEQTEKPDVKYRGIFINDEENFEFWSRQFENSQTSPGTPNADTYAKVFELMLRLKANSLWPAMHEYSDSFNAMVNPETGVAYNAEMADRYGIVMGSSHCEMLLRTNTTEWEPWCEENQGKYNLKKLHNDWKASYDYTVNPEAMNVYWEERVAQNYRYENMYTIGLRSVHDAGINCANLADQSYKGKAGVVKQAVQAQVAILEKYEKLYEQETGEKKVFTKVFCPYKEAAEYYKYDLALPKETIIVWADDNHGYVRQFPTQKELDNYAGSGIYYHVSYWGVPESYLWVASTPLSLIYEEMSKAYNAGSDSCWILNVGDIKPAELQTEFFLNMGWNVDEYTYDTIPDFTEKVSARNFGVSDETAKEITDIIEEYHAVNIAKRPEFQGKKQGSEYSLVQYGDEAQIQINRMNDLCERSQRIYDSLPEQTKDSYYQLVHYQLRASKYTFEKNVYQQKNQLYLNQGRFASVNQFADAAESAFRQIIADLKYYNKELSGGKWDGIIDPYQGTKDLPTIQGAPTPLTRIPKDKAQNGLGSVCEGQSGGSEQITLEFNELTDDQRFIDIFNKGLKKCTWQITAGEIVKLTGADGAPITGIAGENGTTVFSGTVGADERLWVSIDWEKAAVGTNHTNITVTDEYGLNKSYKVKVVKPAVSPAQEKAAGHDGYYESCGEVAIEAERFSTNKAVGENEWKLAKNLGRSGDSMKLYPDTAHDNVRIDENFETDSARLEYEVYFETTGVFDGIFYRVPTLDEGTNDADVKKTCRTAIALDNSTPTLLRGNSYVDENFTSVWSENVRAHIEELPFSVQVSTPGWHTLRVYQSDSGIAFDRIVLRNQLTPKKASHLGAPESFNTIAYEKPRTSVQPVFALDETEFPESVAQEKYWFDFSPDRTAAAAGYIGVDNLSAGSVIQGYSWNSTTLRNVKAAKRTQVLKASARDQGFVYGNQPQEFTAHLPSAGKYVVALAVGDRQAGGIPVKDMRVTANLEEVLSGITVPNGQTQEFCFVTEISEDNLTLTVGLEGNNWAISSLEISPYHEPEQNGGTGAFAENAKGDICIETESVLEQSDFAWNSASSDGKNSEWTQTIGKSGHGMYFGPNRDLAYTATTLPAHNGPKLNYKINFKKPGQYAVWALAKSQDDDDDSFHIALNDTHAGMFNDLRAVEKFTWVNAAQLTVTTAGVQTVSIWGREDGLTLDKLFITANGNAPSEFGGVMRREKGDNDKSELQAAIDAAEAVEETEYTAESYAVMKDVWKQAVLIAESVTAAQDEIDIATAALQQAIENLQSVHLVDADITTGKIASYRFDGNWSNAVNNASDAQPKAYGTGILPTLETDAVRGEVVKVNAGSVKNRTQVSIPNPLKNTGLPNGATLSMWVNTASSDGYGFLWSATDGFNHGWFAAAPYFGYAGSGGYLDVNCPHNLPGSNDKMGAIKTGQWSMITTTITDEQIDIYLNGRKFLSTKDKNYTKSFYNHDMSRFVSLLNKADIIDLGGANAWWGSASFYADDFVMYDRVLESDQIMKLYMGLTDKTALRSELKFAAEEAGKTEIYTADSIEKYQQEIVRAQAVADSGTVDQTTIDAAVRALKTAHGWLVRKNTTFAVVTNDIKAVTGNAGTEFSLPVYLTAFPSDLSYKSIEGMITLPDSVEVVSVTDSKQVLSTDFDWNVNGGVLRFAYLCKDSSALSLISSGELSEIVSVTLRSVKDREEGETIEIPLIRFSAKTNSQSKEFDLTDAVCTVSFTASEKMTAASSELYVSDGLDVIPAGKKAVSVIFTGIAEDADVKLGDVQFYYNSQRSEKNAQNVYVALVDESVAAATLDNVASYTFAETGKQSVTFGNTNPEKDDAIDAQDALNTLSAWLRKGDAPDGKGMLAMNVTADGHIDTTDAIAIVDWYVGTKEFAIINQ